MKSNEEIKEWSLNDTKEYKRFKRKLEIVQNKKMKHKKKIKKWILKHCIDNYGDINLTDLDFSDFDGNIYLDGIQVKKDLHQSFQKVDGDLWQTNQIVYGKVLKDKETKNTEYKRMKTSEEIKEWLLNNCVDENGNITLNNLDFTDFDGDFNMYNLKVKKDVALVSFEVGEDLCQSHHKVKGNLYQDGHKVFGNLYQCNHYVKGSLSQYDQTVGKELYQHNPNEKEKIIDKKNRRKK